MSRGKTILIADDDEGVVALLTALCEGAGYRTIAARNGREAVEKVAQCQPDVILLDALMPEMTGFEAAKKLKTDPATRHLPVIMLTALRSREDRLKGIAAGANDFLPKPIDSEELLIRVRNNLEIKEYHDFLANHATILERQVAERTRELEEALGRVTEANRETILRLSIAAEYRDENTGAHIRRISEYTRAMAAALGQDGGFLDLIFYASAMHDIGKVHIPDSILLKAGPLTAEEWRVMQGHCLSGERILDGSGSPYLAMAKAIAAAHHERWDGTGYPRGLAGEAIPFAARITTIVDQYDALRSERPYKPPMSHGAAVRTIAEGDGRTSPGHFDPAVLAAFVRGADELARIYEASPGDRR
jgi:putative two-component system response regulator